jgi:hypothetical protein
MSHLISPSIVPSFVTIERCSGVFGAVQEHSPNTLNMPILPVSPSPHSPASSSPHHLIPIPMFLFPCSPFLYSFPLPRPCPYFAIPIYPSPILPIPILISPSPSPSHVSILTFPFPMSPSPLPIFPFLMSPPPSPYHSLNFSPPSLNFPSLCQCSLSTAPFCNPLKLIEVLSSHHRELLIHTYTYWGIGVLSVFFHVLVGLLDFINLNLLIKYS